MNKKTLIDRLVRIRDLLHVESRWTKGWFARDAEGNDVSTNNPNAVCFCLSGAVTKTSPDGKTEVVETFLNSQLSSLDGLTIPDFNDDSDHADVLAFLERCLSAANSMSEEEWQAWIEGISEGEEQNQIDV